MGVAFAAGSSPVTYTPKFAYVTDPDQSGASGYHGRRLKWRAHARPRIALSHWSALLALRGGGPHGQVRVRGE